MPAASNASVASDPRSIQSSSLIVFSARIMSARFGFVISSVMFQFSSFARQALCCRCFFVLNLPRIFERFSHQGHRLLCAGNADGACLDVDKDSAACLLAFLLRSFVGVVSPIPGEV